MQIQLPKAEEWNATENCAINLRAMRSAGVQMCEPVGSPATILADAGAATFLLDGGDVLTTSDDRHDIYINGNPLASLTAPLVNVLPLGRRGEAILFTSAGARWLSGGVMQAPTPAAGSVTAEAAESTTALTADVLIPTLRGEYPRLTEPLRTGDCERVESAVADTFAALAGEAATRGAAVLPMKIAWRMIDAQGAIVAACAPQIIGRIRCSDTLKFKVERTDAGLAMVTAASLTVTPWRLHIAAGRSEHDFWRKKVAKMEIVAWPMRLSLQNVGGVLSGAQGNTATLNVSFIPEVEEIADAAPVVIAAIDNPLNGTDMLLNINDSGNETTWQMPADALLPSAVYRGGTVTAYAQASEPGVLTVASGREPLVPVSRHQICGGDIVHICAPVGGGGGWNYGRLHLLVFATDGIFSVSIDSRLQAASSTYVSCFGVTRGDAVAVTPEAVYAATVTGSLLRIVGSRCHNVPFPCRADMLAWCDSRAELWVINEYGIPFVMDSRGGTSLRTDVAADRAVGQYLLVDTFGALRTVREEEPVAVEVTWACRREDRFRKSLRQALWKIDAERAANLKLQLFADSGGTPQRLLELTVNGAINAPIAASVIAPARAYFTACLRGTLTPPARLNSITL